MTRARCRGLPVARVVVVVARARFLAAREDAARLATRGRGRRAGKGSGRGGSAPVSGIRSPQALLLLIAGAYVSIYNHCSKCEPYFAHESFAQPNMNISTRICKCKHIHTHTRAHGRHNKLISRAEVSEHKFPRGNIINKTNTFKWPESLRAPSSAPDITRVQVTSHKKTTTITKSD